MVFFLHFWWLAAADIMREDIESFTAAAQRAHSCNASGWPLCAAAFCAFIPLLLAPSMAAPAAATRN
jgi:hypothetical protein